MNTKRFAITIIIILSFTSKLFAYEKPEKIIFGASSDMNPLAALWLKDIYTEAFGRLGIEFDIEKVPGNRSAALARAGSIDGEIERVYSYLGISENLIRVSENTRVVKFVAYSFDKNIKLNDSWESLANKDYYVGYRMGVKLPEAMLPKYIEKKKIFAARDIDLAMKNLKYQRMDIYIEISAFLNRYKKTEAYKELKQELYPLATMATLTSHAYLNEKHKDLEPELSQILADMKREGLFKKYMDKYGENYNW